MNKYIDSFLFNNTKLTYCDLNKVFEEYPQLAKLPSILKILLESNLRNCTEEKTSDIINIFLQKKATSKIKFYPNRIVLNDKDGIPILIDFVSIRENLLKKGKNLEELKPKVAIDLIIDHSCKITKYSTYDSYEINIQNEIKSNKYRYEFVKWFDEQFDNFSLVPPGMGVLSQINLEYLLTNIFIKNSAEEIFISPENIVSNDSDIFTASALGVLGFGLGDLDIQSLILGLSLSMSFPKIVGVEFINDLNSDIDMNSVAISLNETLRDFDENTIVEFHGRGLNNICVEDRIILSSFIKDTNIKTVFFNIDSNTMNYLEKTRGVDISLIKKYFKLQNLYDNDKKIAYDENIKFDLSKVQILVNEPRKAPISLSAKKIPSKLKSFKNTGLLKDNDIVLAMINSINSANPFLIIEAVLMAKKAILFGLEIKPHIKTIFSPASQVVNHFLKKFDLLKHFEELGFHIVSNSSISYFGNSAQLLPKYEEEIKRYDLDVSCVCSGNSDDRKAIHPLIKSNWFMSPSLVLAYCLKGTVNCNILDDEISKRVFFKDILPTKTEVEYFTSQIDTTIFYQSYKDVFLGNKYWKALHTYKNILYSWSENSRNVKPSTIFFNEYKKIKLAKILAIFDDDVLGEHILPKKIEMGNVKEGSEQYLLENIYSSKNLKNKIADDEFGNFTKDFKTDELINMYYYSLKMKETNSDLVVFCKGIYGKNSFRNFLAKSTSLIGVKLIVAKSFDKKHRIDLIKMGILPVIFLNIEEYESLNLIGDETISIMENINNINQKVKLEIIKEGRKIFLKVLCKIQSQEELQYYKSGGIIPHIIQNKYLK